jgi:hypothetical protein
VSNALRYAVVDANGVKLNGILVDDPYPQPYWPGYGRYIVCEHGEPDPTPPANLDIRTGDRPFSYLTVRPAGRFNIGDTMDLATGDITPAPQPEPEPEPEPAE